jgi:hypothetical protein
MNTEVLADSESVAGRAASLIVNYAWEAIDARGSFVMAVSGGRTPWIMLRRLAAAKIPWRAVHIAQVDERVAPAGHLDRNLTHLQASLAGSPLPPRQLYAMPVESTDLEAGARAYAATLQKIAGLIGDHFSARQGVEDDHMNILCIGGRTVGPEVAWEFVDAYLASEFSQADRHLRRLSKVAALEEVSK